MSAEELITEARRVAEIRGWLDRRDARLLLNLAVELEAAIARQPRTIETVEDLASLELDTVILSDEGGFFQVVSTGFVEFGSAYALSSVDVALPVTVLFEPDKEA